MIRHLSETSVAGNANSDHTVGAGKTHRLLYGEVDLTTDATAANRRVILQVLDASSNVIMSIHAGAVHAASQTNELHQFLPGVSREGTAVNNTLFVTIPDNFCIPTGYSYRIDIENGVAGDSYDTHLIVDEVLEGAKTLV